MARSYIRQGRERIELTDEQAKAFSTHRNNPAMVERLRREVIAAAETPEVERGAERMELTAPSSS